MNIKRVLLPLLILIAVAGYFLKNRPVSHGPGEVAPDDPLQTDSDAGPFDFQDFRIFPLADFEMQARVLGKERYRSGIDAELAPWDIAFGWGPMSDESVLEKITISQGNRFYYWQVKEFPIPRRDIETHSANMHLIPADDGIRDILDDVRVGQVLNLFGQLVRIEGPNNMRWKSSTTRNDTGFGACEVIFVSELSIEPDY